MNDPEQKIWERMERRLKNLFSGIAIALSYDNSGYYVAGNSCNAAAPNDYDLYPLRGEDFDFVGISRRIGSVNGFVICETANALTCNISGKVVQFCKYKKDSLYKLIESFDFAHIQIGCGVRIEWRPGDFEDDPGGYDYSTIDEVAYTPDWEQAHLLETTWYTGSEYPLSSLIRTVKYFQRGAYASKHEYKVDILNILSDIIARGYKDYPDYKDQLAAIDLLLLEPEESDAAWKLFRTCGRAGIVESFDYCRSREEYEDD